MTTPVVLQSIGERVRCIAALHALIAYLEANPDLPAPNSVTASFHFHEGTAGARRDLVLDAAATMGVVAGESSKTSVHADMEFAPKEGYGSLGFFYSVRTHSDVVGF